MRSLFVGLMAAVLCIFSAGAVVAQAQNKTVLLNESPAAQKAFVERAKQREAVAKGDKKAIAAEEKLKADTMALAPTLIQSKALPCTLTDAANEATFDKNTILEVACQEGIGYIIVQSGTGTVDARECISDPRTPLPVGCKLPGNAAPFKGLQPYVARANSDCMVNNAAIIGQTSSLSLYEIACASGTGAMLSVSMPRGPSSKVTVAPCLAIATVMPGQDCNLTSKEANLAPVRALATKGSNQCPLKDQRYVGTTASGSEYFEYACNDGSGFMIQANAKGEYMRNYTCIEATGIAGGCKLTDTSAAMAAKSATYATAVKAAGFNCDVNKFEMRPKPGSATEIVEIACANRPDSAVALLDGGKTTILACPLARAEGYVCSLSKPEDSFAALTEHLKTQGRNTCVVNGARPMGAGRTDAFVEVTCADGGQGFVLSYPLGTGKPNNAVVCSSATSLGGGCTLPGNKKEG